MDQSGVLLWRFGDLSGVFRDVVQKVHREGFGGDLLVARKAEARPVHVRALLVVQGPGEGEVAADRLELPTVLGDKARPVCLQPSDRVAHQAKTVDADAMLLGFLFQQGEVRRAVVVDKEYILAVVTALGNMMRTIRNHNASNPRYSGNPAPPLRGINRKQVTVPYFEYVNVYLNRRIQVDVPPEHTASRKACDGSADMLPF